MITTTTKNEIFNKLQFYYTSRFFNTKGLQVTFARDYENAADFENALFKENTRMFFRDLIAEYPNRNKGHIPTTIINEFDEFTREKNIPKPQQQNWLKHTYNFVKDFKHNSLSSRISKSEAVTFYQWYDTMIIKQPENKDVKDEPKKELHNNIFELKQNNFDEVNPEKVIEHFKILHENGYISKENFELFIKTRFADNKNLTDKIELLKENSRVQFKKIFYKYYDTVINQKYGKKPKYVNLLCENFTGFDYDAISTNFSD
jgi:hypothetical protein